MDQDLKRLQLHELLAVVLGTRNVYFQPPSNLQMKYPCLVYERDSVNTSYADNLPYRQTKRYQVTYIDQNPDSGVPDKLGKLPTSAFNRHFVADNLNHDVYNLFF